MFKNASAKTYIRISLLLGTIVSFFFVPWILVKAWILPLPDSVQEQLEQAIEHGFDGIVVYVEQTGKPVQFYSAGWKNRAEKIPADPHALHKIASIHKLYVAAAMTKLASNNQVDLDKSLAEYFPEFAKQIEYANEIKIKHLIQHRSGLPNYSDTPGYWDTPNRSLQEKLSFFLDKPANFAPNESYQYCNTNYLLLGMLIEKVVGYRYQQYIQEQILRPLALKQTYFSLADIELDQLASGYYVGVEQDIKTNDYGSMIATALDVGKFIRALNTGSLFTAKERELYATLYEFGHGGLIPGYQSLAYYYPDIDTVVVQFINTTDFNGYEWNLSQINLNRIVEIISSK